MIGYASRTGTRSTLDVLRRHGWRLLVSATGVQRTEGFRYALDNGAWTAYQQQHPFDADRFRACVEQFGACADWVAVPDVVMGGRTSLEVSRSWLPWVLERTRLALLVVQDGMEPADVAALVDPQRVGIFIGGSCGWKDASAMRWGIFAASRNLYLHIGRVNTARRLRIGATVGAHSFDGSGASRFTQHAHKMARWRSDEMKQGGLAWRAL